MSFDVQFSILSKRMGTPKVVITLPILIVKVHKGWALCATLGKIFDAVIEAEIEMESRGILFFISGCFIGRSRRLGIENSLAT